MDGGGGAILQQLSGSLQAKGELDGEREREREGVMRGNPQGRDKLCIYYLRESRLQDKNIREIRPELGFLEVFEP